MHDKESVNDENCVLSQAVDSPPFWRPLNAVLPSVGSAAASASWAEQATTSKGRGVAKRILDSLDTLTREVGRC